jgi:hypothetical protein
MADNQSKRIFQVAVVWGGLLIVSFIIPRFVPASEGFASAATATTIFLLLLFLVTLVSVYLLIKTVRLFNSVSITARICGIAPAVIMVIGLISLITFLRY